jgi:sialate O-acetylesterase
VFFDHAGGGLACRGRSPSHFRIAGPDQVFRDAEAVLSGSTVRVSSRSVPDPVAVRFAFGNEDEPNLFNAEGLPASCFRTDEWEVPLP